jgi:predicted nucleic acid-binding protein
LTNGRLEDEILGLFGDYSFMCERGSIRSCERFVKKRRGCRGVVDDAHRVPVGTVQEAEEGILSSGDEMKARAVFSALAGAWSEVQPTEMVRLRAERLLSIHPLRAADALQLAAALIWGQETPRGLEFVCLDQNLREAALKEGFSIQPCY